MKRLMIAASLALALAACNDQYASSGRSIAPIPPRTMALMSEKGMSKSDPILVRLYKKESELEIWKKANDGKYALLKSYPICRWSGQLGPKQREGDRQAPEGFYNVTPAQMNPNSAYYLSFDTGYPNAFDRSHGRTGSQLMVHGTCSSRGCYAMTDEGIAEVYALARDAFAGGQKGFQFQAYPFRMTAENLAKFRRDPNMTFWANLKEGSDHFEITKREPKVAVCSGRYAFDTVDGACAPDPTLAPVVAQKAAQDREAVAELVAKGAPAVKLVYADGGGHETFREASIGTATSTDSQFAILDSRARPNLGDVSRPDALAQGPREIAFDDGRATPEKKAATLLASAARRTPASKVAAASPGVATEESAFDTPTVAKPAHGRTLVANADPEQPTTAAALPPEKPFYDRMIASVVGGGRAERIQSEAKPDAADTGLAVVPTRRKPTDAKTLDGKTLDAKTVGAKTVGAKTGDAKAHDAKGHDAKAGASNAPIKDGAQKHVDSSAVIPGASPIGPLASTFRSN